MPSPAQFLLLPVTFLSHPISDGISWPDPAAGCYNGSDGRQVMAGKVCHGRVVQLGNVISFLSSNMRMKKVPVEEARRKGFVGFVQRLGPGLITGASDDAPSGIGTYSQVGSQFGYGLLWLALFTFPLMSAVQVVWARIGLLTGVRWWEWVRRIFR